MNLKNKNKILLLLLSFISNLEPNTHHISRPVSMDSILVSAVGSRDLKCLCVLYSLHDICTPNNFVFVENY